MSRINLDLVENGEAATQKLPKPGLTWDAGNADGSRVSATSGVFTVSVIVRRDSTRLEVVSPCYFVKQVDDTLTAKDVESVGGFVQRPWTTD